ncbi:MAG: glucose-1-phosphate adenylyltransferase, partial [Dehalococcoidia bacterium]
DLASMGVYLFKKDVLQKLLEEDAHTSGSRHDFGRNVIPKMAIKNKVSAYKFDGYWRDVGTVQAYWEVNMELLEWSPPLLFDVNWPVRTQEEEGPPAIITEKANVINSMISNGCIIEGRVEHSVLSPGVTVIEGAVVKDSIIMSHSIISSNSVVDRSIIDKEVVVETDCRIGFSDDFRPNRLQPKALTSGITIVGKKAQIPAGTKIGRNCVIHCGVTKDDFSSPEIPSGETIEPKRRRHAQKE